MSDSNLAVDYDAMMERVGAKLNPMATTADLVAIMRDEIFPFLGNVREEIGEIDGVVEDILHNADDILQPETSALFAAIIVGSKALLVELRKRVDKAKEPKVWQGITKMDELLKQGEQTLADITVPDDEEEDDDDGDDGEKPIPASPAGRAETDDDDDDDDGAEVEEMGR